MGQNENPWVKKKQVDKEASFKNDKKKKSRILKENYCKKKSALYHVGYV